MSVYHIFFGANRSRKSALLMNSVILAIWAASALAPVMAQDSAKPVEFDIQADNLEDALKSYSLATDRQVMFSTDIVERKPAKPVMGQMTADEALAKLLDGSGLIYEATPASNVILVRAPQQQAMLVEQRMRQAQAQPEEVRERRPGGERGEAEGDEPRRDEITVTGTLIKGIAPDSSPTLRFNRDDILNSGVTSTEQFIRLIPQNFGGGSTELLPSGAPNDINSSSNTSLGSGANIRGLGSGATLTLLNGNRIAPSSSIGDFVDLSMIPISALERVDVLTDGASSIYGADAVSGVINFVLRNDFQGAESSLRYGAVTSGEMEEWRASQTFGASWNTGNIIATYELSKRENLVLADRPQIAIPTFNSGEPVSDGLRYDLLPEQKRHSVLLAANQDVSPQLRVSASALYSNRNAESTTYSATTGLNYLTARPNSEVISATVGADLELTPGWSVSTEGAFSEVRTKDDRERHLPSYVLRERRDSSQLWTGSVLVNGDVFEAPGGLIKLAIGAQYRSEEFGSRLLEGDFSRKGDRDVWAGFGELFVPIVSEVNSRPGLQRLEVSVSGRLDHYSDFGTTTNPKVGLAWSPVDDLVVRGTYSTSFAPPALGRAGALDQTAFIASYDWLLGNSGQTLPDPSLAGVNFLSATGTARDLDPETSRAFTVGVDHTLHSGRHTFSTNATYYNIDFEGRLGVTPIPGNLSGFSFAPAIAFEDPSLFPPGSVEFFPSDEQIQRFLDEYAFQALLNPFGVEVENIGFINRVDIVRNLARTKTSGADLQFNYQYSTDAGAISIGLNANYIFDFIRQASLSTPEIDALNTLYNPTDLKIRSKIGYYQDGWSGTLFVNYTDGYQTDSTPDAQPINSWTTIDATLSHRFNAKENKLLNGTTITFSIQNVFDQDPPFTPTFGQFRIAGYDPTNASPVGRFLAFEVRKAF